MSKLCERLPSTATKEERHTVHRNKMEWNKQQRPTSDALCYQPPRANLSRRHPDYGLSVKEHERRKRERS